MLKKMGDKFSAAKQYVKQRAGKAEPSAETEEFTAAFNRFKTTRDTLKELMHSVEKSEAHLRKSSEHDTKVLDGITILAADYKDGENPADFLINDTARALNEKRVGLADKYQELIVSPVRALYTIDVKEAQKVREEYGEAHLRKDDCDNAVAQTEDAEKKALKETKAQEAQEHYDQVKANFVQLIEAIEKKKWEILTDNFWKFKQAEAAYFQECAALIKSEESKHTA